MPRMSDKSVGVLAGAGPPRCCGGLGAGEALGCVCGGLAGTVSEAKLAAIAAALPSPDASAAAALAASAFWPLAAAAASTSADALPLAESAAATASAPAKASPWGGVAELSGVAGVDDTVESPGRDEKGLLVQRSSPRDDKRRVGSCGVRSCREGERTRPCAGCLGTWPAGPSAECAEVLAHVVLRALGVQQVVQLQACRRGGQTWGVLRSDHGGWKWW